MAASQHFRQFSGCEDNCVTPKDSRKEPSHVKLYPNVLVSLPRSRRARSGSTQPRARLQLETLEAREVCSNGIGPDHTVADSAADQYENMALQSNVPADIKSDLLKGLEALRAADHPVTGFYKLEYYFANLAHDYDTAYDCYIPAVANAKYWANYDPNVKSSGSDREYGIVDGMIQADNYYDKRWDGTYAQDWRNYARNQVDLWNTTPLSQTIAGWWHIGTGPGWVYISPVSATQVTRDGARRDREEEGAEVQSNSGRPIQPSHQDFRIAAIEIGAGRRR
jgi:hypothetical protein